VCMCVRPGDEHIQRNVRSCAHTRSCCCLFVVLSTDMCVHVCMQIDCTHTVSMSVRRHKALTQCDCGVTAHTHIDIYLSGCVCLCVGWCVCVHKAECVGGPLQLTHIELNDGVCPHTLQLSKHTSVLFVCVRRR
jgi:hypothetical protein